MVCVETVDITIIIGISGIYNHCVFKSAFKKPPHGAVFYDPVCVLCHSEAEGRRIFSEGVTKDSSLRSE